MEPIIKFYRQYNYLHDTWHVTKVIVLSFGKKTAKIKFAEPSFNNKPGDVKTRVHLTSLFDTRECVNMVDTSEMWYNKD